MGQQGQADVLPNGLVRDGWWLDDPAAPAPGATPRQSGLWLGAPWQGHLRPVPVLGGLVLLADLLFWGKAVGVSLPLFAMAVFGFATLDLTWRARLRPAVLLTLAALPTVVHVQALSVALLTLALAAALVWARVSACAPWFATGLAWLRALPGAWTALISPRTLAQSLGARHWLDRARQGAFLRDWAFPLGGTLVLAGLLTQANPVLARAFDWQPDWADLFARLLFWLGMAVLLSPLLRRSLPAPLQITGHMPDRVGARLGLNRGSVLRALAVFNAVLALQTGLDLTILLGGAALPEGMSYAEYAHRGAYPLVATAVLAGIFALAANPFLREHAAIRPLMLLWLVQNVVICGTALLRTDLYVAAYGLTHLRLSALIWMGLVAALLALAVWQVLRERPNAWLLGRGLGLCLATLYAVCFVNFADFIASQNLRGDTDPQTAAVRVVPVDMGYVCSLGPGAQPALREALDLRPTLGATFRAHGCDLTPPVMTHWQEWGLRKARLSGYDYPVATTLGQVPGP